MIVFWLLDSELNYGLKYLFHIQLLRVVQFVSTEDPQGQFQPTCIGNKVQKILILLFIGSRNLGILLNILDYQFSSCWVMPRCED